MLFYSRGKLPADWHPLRMNSLDGGATWSKPVALGPGVSGPAKDKPVELSNGIVIAGSSTEYDGWRIHFRAFHGWRQYVACRVSGSRTHVWFKRSSLQFSTIVTGSCRR
ncbi:exo-alpha-sialidase [Paraburkholderia dipogonis]|uniref:exo-alpha-sialidase n=1 Tax=Paraburkholderia dipogonis TaxID=1211383 RepID=UPI0035ECB59B